MADPSFDPRQYPDTVLPSGSVKVADRPTARLAALMISDVDRVSDQVVNTIRGKLASYTTGQVPRDDLWWSVRANIEVLMRIIAEDRELTSAEIADRAALGARRARQHLAVTQLIQAFQIGYIEVWRLLTEAAKREGVAAIDDLVDVAGHFWAMMHQVSASVAEAYHQTSRQQGSEIRRQAQTFLDLLQGLPAGDVAARDDAHALGLDPDGDLIAAVRKPRPDDDLLRMRDRGIVMIERPEATILLANTTDEQTMFADQPGPLGIGLARPGLEGAIESIRDAHQAFDAARRLSRGVVRFRDDWFACILASQLARLHPLVEGSLETLGSDDFTTETIQAFIDCDGRLGVTGRALNVHANTVSYRLERFAERSGINPRTSDGLLRVRLALLLTDPPATA